MRQLFQHARLHITEINFSDLGFTSLKLLKEGMDGVYFIENAKIK